MKDTQTAKAEAILNAVCDYSQLSIEDLRSPSRVFELNLYRQLSMYLIHENTMLPLLQIAKILGRSNHATSIHAIRRVEDLLWINDSVVTREYKILSHLLSKNSDEIVLAD